MQTTGLRCTCQRQVLEVCQVVRRAPPSRDARWHARSYLEFKMACELASRMQKMACEIASPRREMGCIPAHEQRHWAARRPLCPHTCMHTHATPVLGKLARLALTRAQPLSGQGGQQGTGMRADRPPDTGGGERGARARGAPPTPHRPWVHHGPMGGHCLYPAACTLPASVSDRRPPPTRDSVCPGGRVVGGGRGRMHARRHRMADRPTCTCRLRMHAYAHADRTAPHAHAGCVCGGKLPQTHALPIARAVERSSRRHPPWHAGGRCHLLCEERSGIETVAFSSALTS